MDIAQTIVEKGIEGIGRFYSIYKAYVVDNDDPQCQNRLKVSCFIHGGLNLWALPKGQHGSLDNGFKYFAPKIGDVVWISFEQGDPSKPVWEYYGWASGEMPMDLDSPNRAGIVTPNGTTIILDDDTGNLDIYVQGKVNIYSKDDINIGSARTVNLNGGNNGGVINIVELTEKLNKLVSELEKLKLSFNTHIHTGVTTGPSVSGIPTVQHTSPFSVFNKTDYEDLKFNH